MKENEPLVSVIMSEYNTNINLLKESIKSILNQTYTNLELIIIDDCGKNDVKKIVSEFQDERIKIYRNEKNSGLTYSLNKAINLSRGKYIARMDTDDFSYIDRLEIQVKFMEEHTEYDIIGTNVDYYDGNLIWGRSHECGEVTRNKILNSCPLTHPSVMYKKNIIEKIGGYLNYKRSEDYATWIELFLIGAKIYNIPEITVRYHLSLDDYKKRTLKKRKEFFKMIKEEYVKLKPSKLQLLKIYIKNFIAGILPYKIIYTYHKYKMKG